MADKKYDTAAAIERLEKFGLIPPEDAKELKSVVRKKKKMGSGVKKIETTPRKRGKVPSKKPEKKPEYKGTTNENQAKQLRKIKGSY